MEENKEQKEIKADISIEVSGEDEEENKLHWYSWWPVFFIAFCVFILLGLGLLAFICFAAFFVTALVANYKFTDKSSSSSMPWWYGGL